MHRSILFLTGFALALSAGPGGAGEAAPPAATQPVATAPASSPAELGDAWVQALRRNDLVAGWALLPPVDQARLATQWQRQMRRPDGYLDLQVDTVLRLAQNGAATDQALAMLQPYLAQVQPAALARSIQEVAGFLGLAADAQKNSGAGAGLDYIGLRDWLKELAAWVPTIGLTDQAKARLAIGHLVQAITSSGLRSAAEVRAMALPDLLARLGPALPALKQALAVYDVRLDALLESFTFAFTPPASPSPDPAAPEPATIVIGFTALDKPRTVALRLQRKDGAWQLAGGNDNPLTSLSQLVMMTLLMQGMGGAPAAPPAAGAQEHDGAL